MDFLKIMENFCENTRGGVLHRYLHVSQIHSHLTRSKSYDCYQEYVSRPVLVLKRITVSYMDYSLPSYYPSTANCFYH